MNTMLDTPTQERTTGAENVLWDLSIFYSTANDPRLELDMEAVQQSVDAFVTLYRGRVAQLKAAEMLEAIQALEAIYDKSGRIGNYASLLFSEDTANPAYGALVQKATEFGAQMNQKLVFFDLEWNQADDTHARSLIADPLLAHYRHMLEAERRYKPYQLSEIEEQLLVEKSVTGRSAWTRFFTQLTSSIRIDLNGQKVNLT
jgi:oligoendopeptidase F